MDSVALANAKYGHDPNYRDYVNRVPLILPLIPPPRRQFDKDITTAANNTEPANKARKGMPA